jgi:aryl-alcohol dehydrogenase-like predicted oxidoreductase
VKRAYALGINHFDTGPSYAAGGAEKRLALAIGQLPRDRLVLSTKAGTYVDQSGTQFRSFEPTRIRAELERSLQRLGVAHVDILYLHGPATGDLSTAVVDCLEGLKDSGLISYSGVNSFDPAVLRKLVGLPIDAVMPQYSIFDVRCAPEIAALATDGKIIVSGTVLGQGIVNFRSLIPSNRKSLWYLLRALKNDPWLPLTRLQAQRRISALGRPALDAALLFLMKTPGITSAVFGTTSMAHLEANTAAAGRVAEFA